jgi:hypothetical protein
LYFFSGSDDFLICDDDAVGRTFMAAAGMFFWGGFSVRVLMLAGWLVLSSPILPQSDGRIVWCASVGVGFKVRLDFVAVWCSFVVDFLSSMGVVV